MENFDFDYYNNVVEVCSNDPEDGQDQFQIILNKVNAEVMSEKSDFTWTLLKSQKHGYKVVSCGYAYTIDKPTLAQVSTAKTIYWKCELHKNCKGRAKSDGLQHPLKHTKKQIHNRDKSRREVLLAEEEIKEKALTTNDPPRTIMTDVRKCLNLEVVAAMSKPDAIRQMINRTRSKKFSFKKLKANSLSEIEIPIELRKTYRDEEFYWDDTGCEDKNRIIIFTTKSNLQILDHNLDWYVDGTFYISPTYFKQIYTFHVIKNSSLIPCVYVMLPNKRKSTYKKLFKMLKSYLVNSPKSINMDFEKAAMTAAQEIFKWKIFGCFFHLSQSMFRRVQTRGYLKTYALDDQFRHSFKLVQALAFLPVQDVTQRVIPLYPIETWNVFDRVKRRLPRTNNNVENWHSRIQADVRKKMNMLMVVEILRLEQSKSENDYAILSTGEVLKNKFPKLQQAKERNIER
ncbi:hypothetical protein BpHYR1_006663 [Brachionus plicatilis]|uniref:MULE transposase domain-containing protein n=1 Tax=Brachionus plicatilis TaxID=10195 RepID=A0A3M7QP43_BRAPC|nr:hypothetical protein BpHYR1_006663 [Brachionus plicatilis]